MRNLGHRRQLQSQTTAHARSQNEQALFGPRHQQLPGCPELGKRRLVICDCFECPYSSEVAYPAFQRSKPLCVGRRFLTSGRTDGLFCLNLRSLHHGVQWPLNKLLIGGHFQTCQHNSRSLSVKWVRRESRQVQLKSVRMVGDLKLGASDMFHP